jgi:hypothetical protein
MRSDRVKKTKLFAARDGYAFCSAGFSLCGFDFGYATNRKTNSKAHRLKPALLELRNFVGRGFNC